MSGGTLARRRPASAPRKAITEDDVLRSAKRLDEGLREVSRRFCNLLWDLRHVHPDVRFALCGPAGAEGLSETAVRIFDKLRFDAAADDVPSFEQTTRDALKLHALRR